MNRNKLIAMFLVTFLVASIGTAIASSPVVDIGNGQIDILGSTTTVNIILNEAPNGFSGYNLTVSLSNPSIAEIVSVSYPSWATLHDNSTLPADSVWMKAVDLNDQVKSGDMNILLGTLMIRGDSHGESNIIATVTKMDDDDGYPINTSIDSGHLEVGEVGGPTYVSGIISSNTTWTAADSPYIVTGNILVEEGVTLTIEPAVVVKFNSAKAIQIDGELIARGTEAESIVFTSNQSSPAPGDWCNIVFSDSSVDATYDEAGDYLNGCIMQYYTVEYGGRSDTPAIKIVSSSPFIDHCTISNNAYFGICVDYGSPKITNSTINNNPGKGIYTYHSTVTISGNTITNNSGIGSGILAEYSTVVISGNTIVDNTGGGVYGGYVGAYRSGAGGGIYNYRSTMTICENTIINNYAEGVGGGIFIYGGAVVNITRNIIKNNLADEGGGIFISVYYGQNTVSISYNEITGNSASEGEGGGICIEGQPTINYNNIYNNTPYDVYNANSQGTDVNASYNWWGTTGEATIQAHIYDWYDDASLGIVDYSPYLTEPVTPENMPPIASFTYSPENPVVDQTITFNASNSTDPDGYITNYGWNFGDGNTGTGEAVTHSYFSAGDHTVNLTVTDDDGATDTTSKVVKVYPKVLFFDTGAGTYPSIMGVHNGTIIPSSNIYVHKIYTYPCTGTGGHTEYIKIWDENTSWNVTATWNGYVEDWQNITFDSQFTLESGKMYNYTVRTGSYPQIIHATSKEVTGGTITCTEFVDANGKVYNDWIPAIRLE